MSTASLTRIRSEGRLSDMWHNIIENPNDLPSETGLYLVRHVDGSMTLRRFTTNGFYFWTDKDFTVWTDHYELPGSSCLNCPKAHWQDESGCMRYTCNTELCAAPDADDFI